MPQISFPHGLDFFMPVDAIEVRFVSDNLDLEKQYHFNNHSRQVGYSIVEIVSQRKAKGDWSNWKVKPNMYVCKIKAVEKVDFENLIEVN